MEHAALLERYQHVIVGCAYPEHTVTRHLQLGARRTHYASTMRNTIRGPATATQPPGSRDAIVCKVTKFQLGLCSIV